jgi:phosphate transport system substrate-binding protein
MELTSKGFWKTGIAVLLLPWLLAGCGRQSAAGHLTLTGSSTVAPLALEIAKRYEAAHPDTRIDVQTGGSSRGIADARAGSADIGMVSRALGPDEGDLQAHTIARDGVAVIVHADNPVAALSDDQVRDLFSGRIADWQALTGTPRPVSVVNKAEGRATLEVFLAHFGLRNEDIRAAVVIGENEQGIKTVAGNPGAIGYVSVGAAEHAAAHGTPIRLLALNGVPASTQAVRDGRYALARPLSLVTHGPAQGPAAEFVAYAGSPAMHDLVESLGFVPVD